MESMDVKQTDCMFFGGEGRMLSTRHCQVFDGTRVNVYYEMERRHCREEARSSFAMILFTARSYTKWLWRVSCTFHRNFVEPLFIDLRAYALSTRFHRSQGTPGWAELVTAECCQWMCICMESPTAVQASSLKMNKESKLIINLLHVSIHCLGLGIWYTCGPIETSEKVYAT